MAVVKMGAIITEIAGSVGGSNFRRFRGSTVMSNKTFGASRNKLKTNTGLFQNIAVIQEWVLLTQVQRDNWNAAALLFQFPNKFGDLVYLSGRQLYIKLVSSLRNTVFPDPDPTTLSSVVPIIAIVSANLDTTPEALITLDDVYSAFAMLVQAQRLRNETNGPVFNRRQVIFKENVAFTPEVFFTSGFWDKFPYAQVGDWYRLYITPINTSGFKGQTQNILLQVS